MRKSKPQAMSFDVNDLTLKAQRWNNITEKNSANDCRQILCLHGWLDNSASFEKLAPLLAGYDVVALDMAGHGYSSHRSLHGSYNIWDDLEDIAAVADVLEWKQFYIIGHSRGAIISCLATAVLEDRIKRTCLLDGFMPYPGDADFVTQIKSYLKSRRKLIEKESIYYATVEQALEKRLEMTKLSKEDARNIIERDLEQTDSGYVWRHDSRLHGASAVKLTQIQIESILRDLSIPTQIMIAEEGFFAKYSILEKFSFIHDLEKITLSYHPGQHHFHAESSHVESIARNICEWFE